MENVKTVKTMEIDENVHFQNIFWKAERIGWVIMLFILIAAFLGLAGGEGVVNNRSASNEQLGITAEYMPYLHRDAGTELTVHIDNSKDSEGIFISDNYIDKVEVRSIIPQPQSVQSVPGGYVYKFDASSEKTTAHFYLWPDNTTIGGISARIGSSPEKSVAINQWVYP